MGLMQGRVQGDTLIILDSFALPVQGTETRVSAGNEALEYMAQYIESSEKVRMHSTSSTMLNYELLIYLYPIGWKGRECHRVVSLTSWLRLLALWYRCLNSIGKSKVSRSICGRCGKYIISSRPHLLVTLIPTY